MVRKAVRAMYRSLARHWPLYGGVYRITRNPVASWAYGRTAGEEVATLRNGIRITVDPSDMNGRMISVLGTADPRVVAVCRALLRPGDVFADLGANYGSVGLQCVDRLGSEGRLLLVEPQPDLAERVRAAVGGAGLTNAEVCSVAVLDRNGSATLSRPEGHSGAGSIAGRVGDSGSSFTVPLVDTYQFLTERGGGRPCGVKIDVEGVGDVVLGAALRVPTVRFIVFESTARERRGQMAAAVSDAAFSLFGITRNPWRVTVESIDASSDISLYHDLVAVRFARPASALPKRMTLVQFVAAAA